MNRESLSAHSLQVNQAQIGLPWLVRKCIVQQVISYNRNLCRHPLLARSDATQTAMAVTI